MFIEHTCPPGQSNHPAVAQNAFLLWKVSLFLFQAYMMKDSALLCFGSSGAELMTLDNKTKKIKEKLFKYSIVTISMLHHSAETTSA